jgi:pyrroline-5-carboxylate reductase
MPKIESIGIIGLGKMGEALVSGLLASESYSPQNIFAYDIVSTRCRYISSRYKIKILNSISELSSKSEIIIIIVKPQDITKVLREIQKVPLGSKIILSVAAGISTSFLMKHLPKGTEVIRAMPNLACSINEGMICVTAAEETSKKSLDKASDLLKSTGEVLQIDERYMDAVTGVSGSGPAYLYVFIEALADAGVRLGLKRDVAFKLAAQTTLGAGKLVVSTGEHPAKLKDMVVTPGGTTIEGLIELEKGGLRAIIIEAVSKAAEKAQVLQSSLNKNLD